MHWRLPIVARLGLASLLALGCGSVERVPRPEVTVTAVYPEGDPSAVAGVVDATRSLNAHGGVLESFLVIDTFEWTPGETDPNTLLRAVEDTESSLVITLLPPTEEYWEAEKQIIASDVPMVVSGFGSYGEFWTLPGAPRWSLQPLLTSTARGVAEFEQTCASVGWFGIERSSSALAGDEEALRSIFSAASIQFEGLKTPSSPDWQTVPACVVSEIGVLQTALDRWGNATAHIGAGLWDAPFTQLNLGSVPSVRLIEPDHGRSFASYQQWKQRLEASLGEPVRAAGAHGLGFDGLVAWALSAELLRALDGAVVSAQIPDTVSFLSALDLQVLAMLPEDGLASARVGGRLNYDGVTGDLQSDYESEDRPKVIRGLVLSELKDEGGDVVRTELKTLAAL